MIYLITGNMGSGKSAMLVNWMLDDHDGLFTETLENGDKIKRPLYFCHIDGLDKRHFRAHELTEEEIQSAPLQEVVPEGSVVIVDEADYTYPVLPPSKGVPDYIKHLKELRHYGLTLIVMTQFPTMLNKYLRDLVSIHHHIERKAFGPAKLYTFYKCVTELTNPHLVSGVTSVNYKPDKKAFKYYKSSAKHIKFKKPIPRIVIAFIIILFVCGYFIFNFYNDKKEKYINPATTTETEETNNDYFQASKNINDENLRPDLYVPTISEKPESKPIYNGVRKVTTFEFPVGCVQTANSCNCYSDQGTILKEIPVTFCESYLKDGIFNPYKQITQSQARKPDS